MNDQVSVSIIMPCYNCQDLLEETLQSLEDQTCQNFEVICINDGSTDRTAEVLKAWKEKGTLDITVIDKKNAGVSAARNDGIRAAKGEYVIFLDSDDAYHEAYIEKMLEALESSGADVAYCRVDRKYDTVMNISAAEISCKPQSQTEAMENLLYRMGEFSFCCYVYRAELLKKQDLSFDCNTKFGEDREFNWKYLCHCSSACFVDAPLYWYRVNHQSATRAKASWRKTDLLHAVKRIEKYLQEHNCQYSAEFNSYMYARAMWAVAKTFAVSKDAELFERLRKEFDVKSCMKVTKKDRSKLVAIASWAYLIHPKLFYTLIGLKK